MTEVKLPPGVQGGEVVDQEGDEKQTSPHRLALVKEDDDEPQVGDRVCRGKDDVEDNHEEDFLNPYWRKKNCHGTMLYCFFLHFIVLW